MKLDLCNCGRPNRYTHGKDEDGNFIYSCNKYAICPTYDELSDSLVSVKTELFNLKKNLSGLYSFAEAIDKIKEEVGEYEQPIFNFTKQE